MLWGFSDLLALLLVVLIPYHFPSILLFCVVTSSPHYCSQFYLLGRLFWTKCRTVVNSTVRSFFQALGYWGRIESPLLRVWCWFSYYHFKTAMVRRGGEHQIAGWSSGLNAGLNTTTFYRCNLSESQFLYVSNGIDNACPANLGGSGEWKHL